MDEKTLVERSQNGRRDAFEELVRMYNQKVFALAYGFSFATGPRPMYLTQEDF